MVQSCVRASYLVRVHEEKYEQNQLRQQDDQQNNKKLKEKDERLKTITHFKVFAVIYIIQKNRTKWTYAQQQALVLLDGTEATQEARYHDNGAQGNDQIGSGEGGERGWERGEAALRNGQPDTHT